ncbi:MAG: hypothetical protein Kow0031_41390 [Anaerolineae bacterium]
MNPIGNKRMWLALTIAGLMLLLGGSLCLMALPRGQAAPAQIAVQVVTPAPLFTLTPTPSQTPTASPSPTPSQTPLPTATATRVVSGLPNITATFRAVQAATAQAETEQAVFARLDDLTAPDVPPLPAGAAVSHRATDRLALAHYFAWFDGDGWSDCNISAGDRPAQPYSSDDPAAIARHVQQAQAIGLDGFLLHWFAPGGRTDRNFGALLAQSRGSRFSSTVVFSRHIWHGGGASRQTITEALAHIIGQYGNHPNFLRVEGKPVIFFTDVYRTPATGESPQQFWAAVRRLVDPQQQTVWIAEGLDASYLAVFDGLYVFKITHAAYPHDYQKSPRWANRVRRWAEQTGRPKLWLATISPGWDDLRSGCRPDVRVDNTLHRLDRAGGDTYRATFDAAMESRPDWLLVGSYNEWVEGSYIEPSAQYGDTYLQLTAEFVRRFKAGDQAAGSVK